MCGKWHVGEDRTDWPTTRGFDHYFGLISGSSHYFQLDQGKTMAMEDQPYTPPEKGFHMTDAFTDHALGFLDRYTARAVRQDSWKLVSRYKGGNAWELYDMESDRTEMNNLGAKHTAKVKELSSLWDAWAARVGVQPRDVVRTRKAPG